MASAAPLTSALYSASVLDLETVDCFFKLQDTKFGPIKTAYRPVGADHQHIRPDLHQ
jgi:hypothetical protein